MKPQLYFVSFDFKINKKGTVSAKTRAEAERKFLDRVAGYGKSERLRKKDAVLVGSRVVEL